MDRPDLLGGSPGFIMENRLVGTRENAEYPSSWLELDEELQVSALLPHTSVGTSK